MIFDRLKLPYPPATNRLWRTTHTGGVSGKRGNYASTEYKLFKAQVDSVCVKAQVTPFLANVLISVQIDIYRPRRSGDLDGRIKGLLDALNGWAWVDDSQIVQIVARRFDDKDNPRAEVTVESVDEATWGKGSG